MNLSSAFTWLKAVITQREDDSNRDTDRGDMGTAFGLDASIAPWDASDDDGDASPPERASGRSRRLVRRSAF